MPKTSTLRRIGSIFNIVSQFAPKYASKKALALFSTPRQGRVLPEQAKFLNTAKTKVIAYNSHAITTYQWEGSKATILLAHGWESNAFRWKALIEKLQKLDYNIIALDAPAHGNSSGKLFNAVLYSECINAVANHFKPKSIIGHSVGGMAAGFFQHKFKADYLEQLILLGAPSNFTGVFKRYVDMMGFNNKIEYGLNQLVYERYNKTPDYFSLSTFSKDIKTQGLIIHDTKDAIIPYSDALELENHYLNSKLISTTGFGHGLRDESVNKHIIEFITC